MSSYRTNQDEKTHASTLDALFGPMLLKAKSGRFDGILTVAPLLSGLEPGTQASKWSLTTDHYQAGGGGARAGLAI